MSTFEDAGFRNERPGLDALMKGVARREFDMVAAWSVDRLGRSHRAMRAKGVGIRKVASTLGVGVGVGTVMRITG